jgi:hypothetical protein
MRTRTVVGLVALVFAFVTVAGLYASGPAWKYSPRHCLGGYEQRPGESGLHYIGPEICSQHRERTNAWERFKGAIIGNP